MMKRLLTAPVLLALASCAPVAPPPPALPVAPSTPAGVDFLARNAAAPGVVSTPTGLQYFVIQSGPATGASPMSGDRVTFDYEGTLTTGETFDSSFARGEPLTGEVDRFVPGFTEALKLMRPGDEWVVWIPPALGYGARASDDIPANSVLRFRMVLRAVTPAAS